MKSLSNPGMTAERFTEYIQNCYNNRFHDDMKRTMIAYLSGYDPAFIACLARIVLLRHPRQYRTAPGPAELERYLEEAGQQYQRLPQDLTRPAIEEDTELLPREEIADQLSGFLDRLKDKTFRL